MPVLWELNFSHQETLRLLISIALRRKVVLANAECSMWNISIEEVEIKCGRMEMKVKPEKIGRNATVNCLGGVAFTLGDTASQAYLSQRK